MVHLNCWKLFPPANNSVEFGHSEINLKLYVAFQNGEELVMPTSFFRNDSLPSQKNRRLIIAQFAKNWKKVSATCKK